MIYTSMSRVIAGHSTAIYSISVSKSLYGCTSSEKEIPPGTWRFFFLPFGSKIEREEKTTWNCHLKEASVLVHRKAVPELFIAYSYEASFSRRPTGVQKINHLSSHWFFFFSNWQDRSTLYSSYLQRLNYRFIYVWWKFKRQAKMNDGKPEVHKS